MKISLHIIVYLSVTTSQLVNSTVRRWRQGNNAKLTEGNQNELMKTSVSLNEESKIHVSWRSDLIFELKSSPADFIGPKTVQLACLLEHEVTIIIGTLVIGVNVAPFSTGQQAPLWSSFSPLCA